MSNRIVSGIIFGAAAACVIAGEFEVRQTIESGGVIRSIGGRFELSGTIGQADAGAMEGGEFQLSGGFWFELPPGDCDEDGIANLVDHYFFTQCLNGPGASVLSGCECFDVDRNGRVDLHDFAITSQSPTSR